MSQDPTKFGTRVYRALQDSDYTAFAVNPRLPSLAGEPVYPDLASLPTKPDVVSVVVPPAAAQGILEACVALGITNVWFQPGAEDQVAIDWGRSHGLTIVEGGPCILVELNRP
ncbi:MAG: CoA-binding protein [Candidatus Sericytochromatia bacterium]|nr:CoA-binding protein [Candidatus Sericytochromatia bacterium]